MLVTYYITLTPRKISMEPEKKKLEEENHLNQTIICWFNVNLRVFFVLLDVCLFHSLQFGSNWCDWLGDTSSWHLTLWAFEPVWPTWMCCFIVSTSLITRYESMKQQIRKWESSNVSLRGGNVILTSRTNFFWAHMMQFQSVLEICFVAVKLHLSGWFSNLRFKIEVDHDCCFLMTLSNVSCAFAGPAGTGGKRRVLFWGSKTAKRGWKDKLPGVTEGMATMG